MSDDLEAKQQYLLGTDIAKQSFLEDGVFILQAPSSPWQRGNVIIIDKINNKGIFINILI